LIAAGGMQSNSCNRSIKMTSKFKLLVASAVIPSVLLSAAPAYAAGTTQGTDITNTVTVNYQVGAVAQPVVNSNTDTFKVDRKVLFTVSEVAPATTTVAPGQQDAIVTYSVSNTANDVLDFSLTAANIVGGAAPRGTDNIDASNLEICVDADGNGSCSGTGLETWGATATIDNLAADTNRTVFVRGDFASTVTNGQLAGVRLTATALNSTGAALTSDTATANVAGTVQNVFADVVGTNDSTGASDGIVSTLDDYTVGAAVLTAFKSSRVVSDPINGTGSAIPAIFPKAIPGAVVEYCISVANAAGAATATNIAISDVVPVNTTFVAGSILLDATVTSPGASQTCAAGTAGGTFASNTVSGTLSNIAASSARALIFRVTIN
jgi:uncharacterized repeat protein (TIGR01451 family)